MADESLQSRLGQLLHTIRNVELEDDAWSSIPDGEKQSSLHPLTIFSVLGAHLRRNGKVKESDALLQTISIATAPTNLGGMALSWTDEISADDVEELLLLTSACMFCKPFSEGAKNPS